MAGNALAVVHDADDLDDETMHAFARETRLSETTFVQSATEEGADYRNRIWTVVEELPFAGHPSLGTAVAVARARGETGKLRYVQQTGAGLQPIEVTLNGAGASASMLQGPPTFGVEIDIESALKPLGLQPSAADPYLHPQVVSTGLPQIIVPLRSIEHLAAITPDFSAIQDLVEPLAAFGIYAAHCDPVAGTAQARYFYRDVRVAEDPATGSAAGPLCAYLSRHAGFPSVEITQGVEMGRPSCLRAKAVDGEIWVSGDVVVVVDGVVRL
jgi:trans-2,3-dihydro-3-hydroxyanthranilate isomerase